MGRFWRVRVAIREVIADPEAELRGTVVDGRGRRGLGLAGPGAELRRTGQRQEKETEHYRRAEKDIDWYGIGWKATVFANFAAKHFLTAYALHTPYI